MNSTTKINQNNIYRIVWISGILCIVLWIMGSFLFC